MTVTSLLSATQSKPPKHHALPPRLFSGSRRWAVLIAAVFTSLMLAGCGVGMGSAQNFDPDEPITVGIIPVAEFAPVYIAEQENLFEEEGLNVELQVMSDAAAIAPSVMNGQLQFGTAAAPPFLTAVGNDIPIKAIANGASAPTEASKDPSAILASPGSDLERPRDLEGYTVAVNALSSNVHVVAAAAVLQDGGDPEQVTFVAMPFPDMAPALERGAVDAISVTEPFQTTAVQDGAEIVSHPYVETLEQGGTSTLLFTAAPFADAQPQVVERFSRAIDNASVLAAENPDVVAQALEEYVGIPPDVIDEMRFPHFTDELSVSSLTHTVDVMTELDFLNDHVEVDGAIH